MGVKRNLDPNMPKKDLCPDCLSWSQTRGCLFVVLNGPGTCKTDREEKRKREEAARC